VDRGAARTEHVGKMSLGSQERRNEEIRRGGIKDTPEPILEIVPGHPSREGGPFLLTPSNRPFIEETGVCQNRPNRRRITEAVSLDGLPSLRVGKAVRESILAIEAVNLEG
jgi:hypothetical protein